jgi:hypothetical protein
MVVFLSIVVLFSLHVSNLGKMGVSCFLIKNRRLNKYKVSKFDARKKLKSKLWWLKLVHLENQAIT